MPLTWGCGSVFIYTVSNAQRKLTKIRHKDGMQSRVQNLVLAPLALLLSACAGETADEPADNLNQDPQLARALNDPLMVDPDLTWRNESNAVIAFRDGHPLPPFEASDVAAGRAREAARLELLEDGQIPSLPAASSGVGSGALADLATAGSIVEAVGSRTDCIEDLDGDLRWSTQLPETSSIMPHGMVQQAAGVDEGTCVIRIVRYLTPAGLDDALEYHFVKADRARFRIERFDLPEAQIRGERRDQKMAVHVRAGDRGMTAVDVIHWRK